jgi:hypothetical protein
MDGPVVTAAQTAREVADVEVVLPFVHADGEVEVREAFVRAVKVRTLGVEARERAEAGSSRRWSACTAPVKAPRSQG